MAEQQYTDIVSSPKSSADEIYDESETTPTQLRSRDDRHDLTPFRYAASPFINEGPHSQAAPQTPLLSSRHRAYSRQTESDNSLVGLGIEQADIHFSHTLFKRQAEEAEESQIISPQTESLNRRLQHADEAVDELRSQVILLRKRRQSSHIKGDEKHLPSHHRRPQSKLPTVKKQKLPVVKSHAHRHGDQKARQYDDCNSWRASATSYSQPLPTSYRFIDDAHPEPAASSPSPLNSPFFTVQPLQQGDASIAASSPSTPHSSTNRWFFTSPSASSEIDALAPPTPSPSLASDAFVTHSSTSLQENVSTQTAPSAPTPTEAPAARSKQATSSPNGDAEHMENYQRHKAIASGIAGGVTGAVLIAILLVWLLMWCKRRRRRRDELKTILDRVAPSGPDATPSFRCISIENEKQQHQGDQSYNDAHVDDSLPPIIEVRMVPSLEMPQMQYKRSDLDLEASGGRHSVELASSRIVGQAVSRDLTFSWHFPKLSVPPAAARALRSSHYVKRRATLPSHPSNSSLDVHHESPAVSLASAAELAEGRTSTRNTHEEYPTSVSMSATMSSALLNSTMHSHRSASCPSAAPSSECVDPMIDHTMRSFTSDNAMIARSYWWKRDSNRNSIGAKDGASEGKTPRSVSTTASSPLRKWNTASTANQDGRSGKKAESTRLLDDSVVLAAHDPIMQEIVARMLAMTEMEQGRRFSRGSLDFVDDATCVSKHRPSSTHSQSTTMFRSDRRASYAGSALQTCHEENDNIIEGGARAHTDRTISQAYSARSVVIHDVDEEDEGSSLQEIDRRQSLPPKLTLTTAAEDGQLQHPISITSIDSAISAGRLSTSDSAASSDSSGSADSSSDEGERAALSSRATSSGTVTNEAARSIGEAFLSSKMKTQSQIDVRVHQAYAGFGNDDTESTIDTLSTYRRRQREPKTSNDTASLSDTFDVAFNEAFSEAADALTEDYSSIDDMAEDGNKSLCSSCNRPESLSPSETGTACLLDDDFPTIPTWKSLATQKSVSTTNASTEGWRSASSMSLATIRQ